jgi:hypothetical protein
MSAGIKHFRPGVEILEARVNPGVAAGWDPCPGGCVQITRSTGVLTVTPPAAQVAPQVTTINQQVASIMLPTGEVLSGHGLKTADAQTPVVTWTRTGPA